MADMGIDNTLCARIASAEGIDIIDVRRVVTSFFSVILKDAVMLPFDNHRRIYSSDVFDGLAEVRMIPCIGRIGPVYSRYIRWRANESGNHVMVPSGSLKRKWSRGEIEDIAAIALSGGTPSMPGKMRGSDLFDRIWIVGKSGKRSARQVIPKNKR